MTTIKFDPTQISKQFVLDTVIPCVRPKQDDEVLTVDLLDLDLYFRCVISDDENGLGSFRITKEMAKQFNLTEDELVRTVAKKAEETVTCKTMAQTLGFDADEDDPINEDDPIFVITTNSSTYGAGAGFLALGALTALAEKMDSDLFIIPSSIHEILAVPANILDKSSIDAMVQQVNATQVLPEEQLAQHAYLYRRESGFVA